MSAITVTRKPQSTPNLLEASDFGFLAQNINIATCSNVVTLGTNGLVYVMKMRTRKPITVTNLHVFVTTAGNTLTSGQNFAALYNGSKALLAQTADQSTAWAGTGMMTMALTAAQSIAPGLFYVAVWTNASTRPSFRTGATGTAGVYGIVSAANAPFATADSSITTTAPSTLGSFTQYNNSVWVGVS